MRGVFTLVSETLAQDSAYRPTRMLQLSQPAVKINDMRVDDLTDADMLRDIDHAIARSRGTSRFQQCASGEWQP
jgi:hypothetical protein